MEHWPKCLWIPLARQINLSNKTGDAALSDTCKLGLCLVGFQAGQYGSLVTQALKLQLNSALKFISEKNGRNNRILTHIWSALPCLQSDLRFASLVSCAVQTCRPDAMTNQSGDMCDTWLLRSGWTPLSVIAWNPPLMVKIEIEVQTGETVWMVGRPAGTQPGAFFLTFETSVEVFDWSFECLSSSFMMSERTILSLKKAASLLHL